MLVAALGLQLMLGGALVLLAVNGFPGIRTLWETEDGHADVRPRVNRFDERRAFALLREQVELGPRPAGSPALRRLGDRLVRRLPNGRFEQLDPTHPGLRNIVGTIPGRRPAIVIGAHYDTKQTESGRFVGANDGAGGTAAVVELARALRRADRPRGAPELRFVLFDGEESPDDAQDFYATGVRGSKAYARAHARELRAMVLLDFIADKRLSIPYEQNSDRDLWKRLRAAAKRVGVGATFPDRTQGGVLDDHVPFARRGVPSIDLIDFDFDCFHRDCDDMSAVSARSLDRVGEAVYELLRSWRR